MFEGDPSGDRLPGVTCTVDGKYIDSWRSCFLRLNEIDFGEYPWFGVFLRKESIIFEDLFAMDSSYELSPFLWLMDLGSSGSFS